MDIKHIKSRNLILMIIIIIVAFSLILVFSFVIKKNNTDGEKVSVDTKFFKFHINSDGTALVLDSAYRDISTYNEFTCPDTLILPDSLLYNGKEYEINEIGDGFEVSKNVKNLIIPEGINSIGNNFCQDSNGLETLSLPSTLANIGSGFLDMWDLSDTFKELNIDKNNRYIKLMDGVIYSYNEKVLIRALLNSEVYEVKRGVIEIAPYSFWMNQKTKKVIIPDGVEKIGEFAFNECETNLEEVVLPDSIKTIGEDAFSYCINLSNVNIPANLIEISRNTFLETGITEARIPEGVTAIGENAFGNCKLLTSLSLPSTIQKIDMSAFRMSERNSMTPDKIKIDFSNKYYKIVDGGLLNKEGTIFYKLICSNSIYTVPETVESIEPYAFLGVANADKVILQDRINIIGKHAFDRADIDLVELPKSVTKIDEYAFANSKVKSIELPNGLETIEAYAFNEGLLSDITIPSTVKMIKKNALGKEGGVLKVTFEGMKPPIIEQQSINPEDGGTTFDIYVPIGRVSEYEKVFTLENNNIKYTILEKD